MYKVFIDNKILILDDSAAKSTHWPSLRVMQKDMFTCAELMNAVKAEQFGLIAITSSLEKAWNNFSTGFTIMEAAGGFVKNRDAKLLMIQRLGKWDLPKGKIEKGESPKEAAVREVCEETGVCDVKIINPEPYEMYHTYTHKSKPILKRTFWYDMYCSGFSGFKIQTEEDITDAKWMNRREVDFALANSYNSIRELLSRTFID